MDSYGLELFLSTPSARRATIQAALLLCADEDFYPRPPRGGRPTQSAASVPEKAISIHALREEGDLFSSTSTQMGRISIHALREEGDRAVSRMPSPYSRFLSTPSARRATRLDRSEYIGGYNFYPRPPRGGRRDVLLRAAAHSSISIHALREEGDAGSSCGASCRSRFLSTPSARRATGLPGRSAGRPDNFYPRPPRGGRREFGISRIDEKTISIHALREEGDIAATARETIHGDFYPRPPRGGRHRNYVAPRLTELFLSTPSARRATAALRLLHPRRPISIHALREEGDYLLDLLSRMTNEFLSTPSARRATLTEASGSSRPRNFYPRPPRGGRPGRVRAFQQHPRISIHALREEGDSPAPGMSCTQHNFYPRPPRGGRPDPL